VLGRLAPNSLTERSPPTGAAGGRPRYPRNLSRIFRPEGPLPAGSWLPHRPICTPRLRDPARHDFRLAAAFANRLILRRHVRDQDPLGPSPPRQRRRARLHLGGEGIDGTVPRLPIAARRPWFALFGWPSISRPLSFGGGLPMTPMRATSSSKVPISPYPAESPRSSWRFPDTKSDGQVRAIGPAAAQLAANQRARKNCPYVFPSDVGDGHFTATKSCLVRLCAAAKIDGVTPHTLRHLWERGRRTWLFRVDNRRAPRPRGV